MARKVDANQAQIVAALREAGCEITDLHEVGHGCPDLLVLTPSGRWLPMEVKSPGGRLNSREAVWHAQHRNQAAIVWSVEEALAAVGR